MNGTAGWLGGACALSGRGLGCCRMHYHTFASAMPSVERTTASAGEVVVAHPSPAPGTVDGMSGDLGKIWVRQKGRVWLGHRSWVVYLEHPATRTLSKSGLLITVRARWAGPMSQVLERQQHWLTCSQYLPTDA